MSFGRQVFLQWERSADTPHDLIFIYVYRNLTLNVSMSAYLGYAPLSLIADPLITGRNSGQLTSLYQTTRISFSLNQALYHCSLVLTFRYLRAREYRAIPKCFFPPMSTGDLNFVLPSTLAHNVCGLLMLM